MEVRDFGDDMTDGRGGLDCVKLSDLAQYQIDAEQNYSSALEMS